MVIDSSHQTQVLLGSYFLPISITCNIFCFLALTGTKGTKSVRGIELNEGAVGSNGVSLAMIIQRDLNEEGSCFWGEESCMGVGERSADRGEGRGVGNRELSKDGNEVR